MKLLFDQNISYRILKKLPEVYSGSRHTQDSDFNDLYLLKGFPPKILWFQTSNLGTDDLGLILKNRQSDVLDFIDNEELGCLELSRIKIR